MNSTHDNSDPTTRTTQRFQGGSLFCKARTVQELTGTPYEWLLERAIKLPASPGWVLPPWAMLLLKLEQLQVRQEEHAGKHVTLPKVLDTMGNVPGMLKALKKHTIPCAPQDLASIPPHMLTTTLDTC